MNNGGDCLKKEAKVNIALVGYGKMGKQIEKILINENLTVKAIIDKFNKEAPFKEVNGISLKSIDVAIDFSSPDTILDNIKSYVEHNVNAVIGTTGWFDKLNQAKSLVTNKIGLIWSGNFSMGVNIYFKIVRAASKIFDKFEEYDPLVYEIHHNQKKDSPSGTALMISNIIKEELQSKSRDVTERLDRKIDPDELHVASIRGGTFPGTHVVMFDSAVDHIEIKHEARSREGLAKGAVIAAKWIYQKKGFYSIDDMMNTII